jgi:hypothetical protein
MFLARSIIALLVCSVSSLAALGQILSDSNDGSAAGGLELSVKESIATHGRGERLSDICRANYDVQGCTDFPLEKLECHCEPRDEQWALTGRATVEAAIHLSTSHPLGQILIHERAHLADLEAGLRAHLDELASRRFGSRRACETFAGVLMSTPHLRVVMNELRVASNVKYGCDRKTRF